MDEIIAFVICGPPDSRYASLGYKACFGLFLMQNGTRVWGKKIVVDANQDVPKGSQDQA